MRRREISRKVWSYWEMAAPCGVLLLVSLVGCFLGAGLDRLFTR